MADPATAAAPALPLSLVLFAGGFDRVHYGLVLASAALAISRPVTLFFTGRALLALTADDTDGRPGWHQLDPADDGSPAAARDAQLTTRGAAGFGELLEACTALGGRFLVCEMGLRALALDPGALRTDLACQVGGVVTLLTGAGNGQVLFI